jgi:hypothetical protein
MEIENTEELLEKQVNKSDRKSVKIYSDCKILLRDDMVYNSVRVDKKRSNMDLVSLAILEYAHKHYPHSFKDWKNKELPGQNKEKQ